MEGGKHSASPFRSTKKEILDDHNLIASQKFLNEMFGAIQGVFYIINNKRQIIYANKGFLDLLGYRDGDSVLGLRLGEVIACANVYEGCAECGMNPECAFCGSLQVAKESRLTGKISTKELRLSSHSDGGIKSWDFSITSTPISLSGKQFYLITLQDISDSKRRLALERIFFHDLLNNVGALNGLLTIIKNGTAKEETEELIKLSEEKSSEIVDEIVFHMKIRDAERGDLKVNIETLDSVELLQSSIKKIAFHDVAKDKHIIINTHSVRINIETDRALFQRVIVNLLKNALEATQKDGTVKLGVEDMGDKARFWVNNDFVIPSDVQMQLFQRSFSTKEEGRGIGTYSIKLLTENYLRGDVSFVSNDSNGTIFSIELNKIWHK